MAKKFETRTCIYCFEEKTFVRGEGGDFNKEHVVPEAFAKVNDSLTLVGSVCTQCNKYFGEKLDPILARGTVEAVHRFIEKQKPAKRINELDTKRVKLELESDIDSIPKSLIIGFSYENDEIKQGPVNQICFKNKLTEDWNCFTESDFDKLNESDYPDLVFDKFKIFGPTSEIDAFCEKLKLRWPKLNKEAEIPQVKLESMASVLYGNIELRAIAKIAFNYFCRVTEKYPLLARSSNFDECRKFIRNGEKASFQVVRDRVKPILALDTPDLRQTKGHLVTVEVITQKDGTKKVVSLVSLFNYLTWEVTLSNDYKGFDEVSICSIHHWDLKTKTCTEENGTKVKT